MECDKNRTLKASDVIKAVERIKCATLPDVTYYFHGPEEQRETGMSVKDVVKYFSNDISVIVVDMKKGRYYRAGKRIFN